MISPDILRSDAPGWSRVRDDPTATKATKDYVLAGMAALAVSSPLDLIGDLGIFLFPFARGTVAATHASGLVLQWVMTMPTEGGLGFRRCQWEAEEDNAKSRHLAQRLHFVPEGIVRYDAVLREGQTGVGELSQGQGSGLRD